MTPIRRNVGGSERRFSDEQVLRLRAKKAEGWTYRQIHEWVGGSRAASLYTVFMAASGRGYRWVGGKQAGRIAA